MGSRHVMRACDRCLGLPVIAVDSANCTDEDFYDDDYHAWGIMFLCSTCADSVNSWYQKMNIMLWVGH